MDKAYSEKKTTYRLCPMPFFLTEGDVAICLLLDINKLNPPQLLPENMIDSYEKEGAWIFWSYLHEEKANRERVVEKIVQTINASNGRLQSVMNQN